MKDVNQSWWGGLTAFVLAFFLQVLPASAEFYFGKVLKLDTERRLIVLETTGGKTKEFKTPPSQSLAEITEGTNVFVETSQDQIKQFRLMQTPPPVSVNPEQRPEGERKKE